ncbi:MAG: FHA domain-containing protein [Desulfococcaceae bacterium]
MIVFCEDCGERNIVDTDEVAKTGKAPRCRSCGDILRISLPDQSDESPKTAQTAPDLPAVLEIRYGNTVLEISQTRPSVTMGRQEHNDLEVIDTRVSRSHARIEYRNGRFVLIDHSTNGTFMMADDGKGANLKRSETFLEGSGIITLGRKVSPDSPKSIRFSLRTS